MNNNIKDYLWDGFSTLIGGVYKSADGNMYNIAIMYDADEEESSIVRINNFKNGREIPPTEWPSDIIEKFTMSYQFYDLMDIVEDSMQVEYATPMTTGHITPVITIPKFNDYAYKTLYNFNGNTTLICMSKEEAINAINEINEDTANTGFVINLFRVDDCKYRAVISILDNTIKENEVVEVLKDILIDNRTEEVECREEVCKSCDDYKVCSILEMHRIYDSLPSTSVDVVNFNKKIVTKAINGVMNNKTMDELSFKLTIISSFDHINEFTFIKIISKDDVERIIPINVFAD